MIALALFLFCLISTAFSAPTAITVDADSPCPSGSCRHPDYTLNPKTCKCYKFYPGTNTNYNQSKEICANDQATMAIIADREDNSFVSAFARNNSLHVNNPWIGLWCWSSVPSSCSWSDGSRLYYTNFAFGYPRANEPVFLNEYDEKWYSYDSSSTGTFICQQMGINRETVKELPKPEALEKSKQLKN